MPTPKKNEGNTALANKLSSMGIQVKPPSQWGSAVQQAQQQANANNKPHTVYLPVAVQPANNKPKPNKPSQGTQTFPIKKGNKPVQAQAGPPVYGPITQAQAQQANPWTAAARRAVPQPVLAAAAADKIRQQYAGIQSSPGAFVTDTNQGLLNSLTQMGLQPTPLNQWGQFLQRMQSPKPSVTPLNSTPSPWKIIP